MQGGRPHQVGEAEQREGETQALQRRRVKKMAAHRGEVGAARRPIDDGQAVEHQGERDAGRDERAERRDAGCLGGLLHRDDADQADHHDAQPHDEHAHLDLDRQDGAPGGRGEDQRVVSGQPRAEPLFGGPARQDRNQPRPAEQKHRVGAEAIGDHAARVGGEADSVGAERHTAKRNQRSRRGPHQCERSQPAMKRRRQPGATPAEQPSDRREHDQQRGRQHGGEHGHAIGCGHHATPGKRM